MLPPQETMCKHEILQHVAHMVLKSSKDGTPAVMNASSFVFTIVSDTCTSVVSMGCQSMVCGQSAQCDVVVRGLLPLPLLPPPPLPSPSLRSASHSFFLRTM